ncbi:hypothetical protein THRCLA_05124, partial [Thraustotheca clavata]
MSITVPPLIQSPSSRVSSLRPSMFSSKEVDEETEACSICHDRFTVFRRRYACHFCSLVVCRQCSTSLRNVSADAVLLESSEDSESSPITSESDVSMDPALLSISSRYSTSSNPSPRHKRRLKERCCKNCVVFTSSTKPTKECELCHDGISILRKKSKCHVCQRFACKKCGDSVDSKEFGLTEDEITSKEEKVWICTECIAGHTAAKERRLTHCYVCNAKFHHFQRKCECHKCHQLMCLQCSFLIDGSPEMKDAIHAEVRECKPCHDNALAAKKAEITASLATSKWTMTSPLKFSTTTTGSTALGNSLQSFERSCAIFFMLVGIVTVICSLLIAYYVFFSSVVPEKAILE